MGKFPSLVGSILYLYTPYRAVQIYVRGAIGEVVIVSLLPIVALFLLKVIKSPKAKTIALTSLVTSIFILL